MPSREGALVDLPAGHTVTVVNLLTLDACAHHDFLHSGGVLNSNIPICLQRLNQNAATSVCYSGTDESSRVLDGQQSSLYPYSSRYEQPA